MFYDFQTESMETMKNGFLNTFQHYGFSIAPYGILVSLFTKYRYCYQKLASTLKFSPVHLQVLIGDFYLKCQPEYVTEEEDSYDAHQKFGGPLPAAAVRRRLLGDHRLTLERR